MDKYCYILIFSLLCIPTSQGQLLIQKNFFDNQNQKIESIISLSPSDSTLEGPYSLIIQMEIKIEGYYHLNKADSFGLLLS